MDLDIVALSRLQFALTALYHFLFVPLTLGLAVLLAIMETVYVMTGRAVWRDMTKFWGVLFGINFAMGVATGHRHGVSVRHELELLQPLCRRHLRRAAGHRRAHGIFSGSHFRGALLLRMGQALDALGTWPSHGPWPIGSNLSALWILIANGWMQNPVPARPSTRRPCAWRLPSFYAVLTNPVAQAKFVHTVVGRLHGGIGLRARRVGVLPACAAGTFNWPSAR